MNRPDVIDVTFAYLGDGLETVSERADERWIEEAKLHLTKLIGRIEAEEWNAEPSSACRHCDFARFCEPGSRWLADRDR